MLHVYVDPQKAVIAHLKGEKYIEERPPAFPLETIVRMNEKHVEVEFTLFSKYGGHARIVEKYNRQPPYSFQSSDVIQRLEYHCGIMY